MILGILSCTKKKADKECTAEEMYSPSVSFSQQLQYLRKRGCEEFRIISAKYGLLKLTDKISPYDLNAKDMDKETLQGWSKKVSFKIQTLKPSQIISCLGMGTNYQLCLRGLTCPIENPMFKARKFLSQELSDSGGDILPVSSLFMDSGSFTLKKIAREYGQENMVDPLSYYDTADFWEYMHIYGEFIQKHQSDIELYANIDVIPDPKLTYRNQKWLEQQYKIKPVPVVHYQTDLKWLQKYIKEGYETIGLGGLVGSMVRGDSASWLDRAFEIVCNTKDRKPKVKIHGFGVTIFEIFTRYPFFSVDNTTWINKWKYGDIFVPKRRKGKWIFSERPHQVWVSIVKSNRGKASPGFKSAGKHYAAMSKAEQDVLDLWLSEIGIPVGKMIDGEVVEKGVTTHYFERAKATLHYFERLAKSLPEYPWAWNPSQTRKGLFV